MTNDKAEATYGQSDGGTGSYRPDLQNKPAQEATLGSLVTQVGQVSATAVPVALQPTQVRRPWRATVRTAFQAFLALAVMAPVLCATAGLDPAKVPYLAGVLAVCAAVTRIMALPAVEAFLRRFIPFLSAAPRG